MNQAIELYTDGSSLTNPGLSGYAYIIRYHVMKDGVLSTEEIEATKGFRSSTNNRMELMAAIEGLEAIVAGIESGMYTGNTINLLSDSSYMCDSINKGWLEKWSSNNWMTSGFQGKPPKPVKNIDLMQRLLNVSRKIKSFMTLNVQHVYGHSGHTYNERCDALAKSAAENHDSHGIDEEFEKSRRNYNG